MFVHQLSNCKLVSGDSYRLILTKHKLYELPISYIHIQGKTKELLIIHKFYLHFSIFEFLGIIFQKLNQGTLTVKDTFGDSVEISGYDKLPSVGFPPIEEGNTTIKKLFKYFIIFIFIFL